LSSFDDAGIDGTRVSPAERAGVEHVPAHPSQTGGDLAGH